MRITLAFGGSFSCSAPNAGTASASKAITEHQEARRAKRSRIMRGSCRLYPAKNPKSEARNPKQFQNPKLRTQAEEPPVSIISPCDFEIVSVFVLRISDIPIGHKTLVIYSRSTEQG